MRKLHPARKKSACVCIVITFILVVLIKPAGTMSTSPMLPSTPISDCTELQNMQSDLTGQYYLSADIDCSASAAWDGGLGFSPVGDIIDPFRGSFDGRGYTISGLTIHRNNLYEVGLFGRIESAAVISDVQLSDIDMIGINYVGGLVGYTLGSLSGISVSGVVTGSTYGVGGLAGRNDGSINNSSSAVNVYSLDKSAGGLVGSNIALIDTSFSTGIVNSAGDAGGLVGYNGGTVNKSYSRSTVHSVGDAAGGLVARNETGGFISDSYASGAVSGGSGASVTVGGLVGTNSGGLGGPALVRNCYSTGLVSGGVDSILGGLIGATQLVPEPASHSYWDRITSGQIASDGGTGKTTTQMMQQATYEEWDFNTIWRIDEGLNYPQLRWYSMNEVFLPAIMRNNTHLSIRLGLNDDEQGIYLHDGGDVDTLLYVLSTNPDLSVNGTGNGDILPSPDLNQIPDFYMQFDVDDAVIFEEPATTRLRIEVEFVDMGTDTFRIEYDAHTGGPLGDGRFRRTGTVTKTNTDALLTTYFDLDEVYFANRTNRGDFRINDMGDGVEYIHKVTVMRLAPAP